jgi:hypothetical protein
MLSNEFSSNELSIPYQSPSPPWRRRRINPLHTVSLPALMMPWDSLKLLCDPRLSLYYSLGGTSFAPMFTSLTLLPLYLSASPYNLSAAIIGTSFAA